MNRWSISLIRGAAMVAAALLLVGALADVQWVTPVSAGGSPADPTFVDDDESGAQPENPAADCDEQSEPCPLLVVGMCNGICCAGTDENCVGTDGSCGCDQACIVIQDCCSDFDSNSCQP